MKLVSVETPEKSVCKMTFSATAEELETASNAVYERTRASYTIKGFAKGEADRAQIEADRGEHTFWYDAINDLMDRDVPALYEAAMAEHGFKAVDEPSYDLVSVKKDEGFVATATTPLQPELNLTQTTGFHVECVTPAVTDKEIDAVLERRRNAAAELVPGVGLRPEQAPESEHKILGGDGVVGGVALGCGVSQAVLEVEGVGEAVGGLLPPFAEGRLIFAAGIFADKAAVQVLAGDDIRRSRGHLRVKVGRDAVHEPGEAVGARTTAGQGKNKRNGQHHCGKADQGMFQENALLVR